jgi:hypothetical protein
MKKRYALLTTSLLLATIAFNLGGHAQTTPVDLRPAEFPVELLRWVDCATTMASTTPVSDTEIGRIIRAVASESPNKDPEFLKLVVAVAVVESKLNRIAQSPTGAVGLMQLSLIGAQEAEQQCPVLRPTLGESSMALQLRLLGLRDNVKYGTCLLDYYMKQAGGNTMNALVLYNGGYQQLTRLVSSASLTNETQQYVLRVHSLLGRCQ